MFVTPNVFLTLPKLLSVLSKCTFASGTARFSRECLDPALEFVIVDVEDDDTVISQHQSALACASDIRYCPTDVLFQDFIKTAHLRNHGCNQSYTSGAVGKNAVGVS